MILIVHVEYAVSLKMFVIGAEHVCFENVHL